MFPYIIQGSNIVLYIDGQPVNIDSSHLNYAALKAALKIGDWESVRELSTIKAAVNKISLGRVEIKEDQLLFDGVAVHNALSTRILSLLSEGFDVKPLCAFMTNIESNPSYRARQELYNFLEVCGLPITEDGHFIAYKKIRSDWKDVYSGTFDNSIGARPKMERRDVNEDPTQTCSSGLHVCSYSYLLSYSGDRIVSVKVNPRDVVSCPIDYKNAKLRVCEYEVLEELDLRAAQVEDVLSQRGAVVNSVGKEHIRTIYANQSLERIFRNMSRGDLDKVEHHFSVCVDGILETTRHEELLDLLLERYTYTDIRSSLESIF